MRHLLINGRFLAGPLTAVNSVALDLSQALYRAADQRGWSVSLIVPPILGQAAADTGLPVRVWGWGQGPVWEQVCLPRAQTLGRVAGFFNTAPLRGRGYVTLLHDAHVFTTPASYPRVTALWRRHLSRRAGAPGNLVLTVSQFACGDLLDNGVGHAACIGVVPNGLGAIGRAVPDRGILAQLGLTKGRPYVVAVGSLLPHKNLITLLRAFAQPDLSGVRLVLTGGVTPDQITAQGWPLPPNVVCAGNVSVAHQAALLAGALAQCVPSLTEGFGLPVIEAMCCATPVLISDCGALPEIGGTVALRLPPGDVQAWVQSLLRLHRDPALCAALGVAGRRHAGQFTWAASAQAAFDHLDQFETTGEAALPKPA